MLQLNIHSSNAAAVLVKSRFQSLLWFFRLKAQDLLAPFWLTSAFFVSAASAESTAPIPFNFRIELRAPSAVSALLEQHLEIFALRNSPRNSSEQLNHLIENVPNAVTSLVETEGYFNSKTTARLESRNGQNTVFIDVDLGPFAVIKDAQQYVSGGITENPERLQILQRRFTSRADELIDERFTQSAWDELKRRSLASFIARDYPASQISDSVATIDPIKNTAHFRIDIDSGPAYVFGGTTIRGLKHFPEYLVLDRVQIEPGQGYRRNDLIDLQTELQNMPHFSSVLVDVELSQTEPFEAPLTIDVQESPLNRVTTNLGYDTNTGAQVGVSYRYLNLLDRAWVFNSDLRLTQKEQSAGIGVTLPRGRDGWENGGNLRYLRSDIQGLQSETYRTGLGRNKLEGNIERYITVEYLTETRELNDGTSNNPKSLTGNFKWIQRNLDSKKNPRDGYMVQAEIGGASSHLLSDANFLRLYTNGVYYQKVGREGVLMLRLELGDTITEDATNVPTDWLFRAGGVGSVRGYAYQSLGVDMGGSVAPGKVLATSSIEYQHPVVKDWRAAIFFDYGSAAEDWQNLEPVGGVGVGARWNSPLGQIGADLAYGLDARKVRFEFAMGLAF